MAKAYISQLHREPRLGGLTALVLTVQYELDTEAEATILLRPGQLVPPTDDSIRHEIRRLGLALQAAAESPQGLSASPRERD